MSVRQYGILKTTFWINVNKSEKFCILILEKCPFIVKFYKYLVVEFLCHQMMKNYNNFSKEIIFQQQT